MDSSSRALLFSSALLFMVISSPRTFIFAQNPFTCRSTAGTCNGLVGYVPPNDTTLSGIQALFTIKHLSSILGANDLPTSTPSNYSVRANQIIKISFPCNCSMGIGVSKQPPIYTVTPGNTMDFIARKVFTGFVTFQQIQDFNGIPDPNKINTGQKLKIPLPCSCDEVNGTPVVHYGHVVQPGSSVVAIAQQYNTTVETLQNLNNLTGVLLAGAVLDVPLRACLSMVSNTSQDYPLLVSNGTYVSTARNCVTCKCDASVSWKLDCQLSQTNSSHCSTVGCAGGLELGNATTAGCNSITCAYAGFNNKTIHSMLNSESTCPASGNSSQPSSSARSLVGGSWRRWNELLIFIHALLLCISLL